jgi:integrase
MGRKERTVRLEPGVYGRYYDSGKRSIRLQFTFRGVRCHETMTGLDPDVRRHVKFARNMLVTIQHEIDRGVFNYLEHFPESRRART